MIITMSNLRICSVSSCRVSSSPHWSLEECKKRRIKVLLSSQKSFLEMWDRTESELTTSNEAAHQIFRNLQPLPTAIICYNLGSLHTSYNKVSKRKSQFLQFVQNHQKPSNSFKKLTFVCIFWTIKKYECFSNRFIRERPQIFLRLPNNYLLDVYKGK